MTKIIIGDCRTKIPKLENESIDCIMTSPPYWGLRDYGHSDQLGLESTPEEYLKNMLNVFDLVKPKLKDIGNCFVNLGDSYSGSQPKKNGDTDKSIIKAHRTAEASFRGTMIAFPPAKSMCMIPQRFAWGMIEHGWILRNEIIWYKPNHMPESVTDRLTKSHEVIYHFVKQGKYYYDLDAIREPHKTQSIERYQRSVDLGANATQGKFMQREEQNTGVPRKAPKWFRDGQDVESFGSPRARASRKGSGIKFGGNKYPGEKGMEIYSGNEWFPNETGKNPGDVWQINTQPYNEAHFAVFPLKLVEKPILAGCPVGGRVLDMFGGSGTVAEFCRHNERECTIIELNDEYKSLIKERSMDGTPTLQSYPVC